MTNLKTSQELQSKVIDFLRFPLIIGVLFIHNSASTIQIDGGVVFGSGENMPLMYYCSNLFSKVIAAIAVPLFFFMSGFLFFLNVNKFSRQTYKNKLSSRIKSLLIPYLFWNFIVLSFYYVVSFIPQLNQYINGGNIDLHKFWIYFWDSGSGYPVSYQFWFIRNLMIVVLLSPIIYFFCSKAKIYGVLLLGILWYLGLWVNITGFSAVSVFFFTAGAYLGINKRNLLDDFGKIRTLSFVLYPTIAVADLLTRKYAFNNYIHNAGIVIGIIFCFNLVSYLFERQKIKPMKFLSAASFFVYAIHEPFLIVTFRKIFYMIFSPQTDLATTTLYFLNVILAVLVALGIYYVLQQCLPKFTSIITGGR